MENEIKFNINDQVVRRWNNRVYYVNHRVCNDEYLVSHKKGSKVKDCQVSEPFKHFPTFLNWWKLQSTDENVEYQLDKDILVKGNRLYSEDTCVLVPRDINMLLIKRDKARGELPIGVTYCKKNKKYKAQFSKYNVITAFGLFDKVIDAFLAYKQAKEAYIKEVANKYKNVIDIRVYDVLMKYEVSIDD